MLALARLKEKDPPASFELVKDIFLLVRYSIVAQHGDKHMPFIDNLPKAAESAYIRASYDRTPEDWYHIVKICIREGITDLKKLPDIPFYLHHPDLHNRSIEEHEYLLIADWFNWQSLIAGLIPKMQKELKPPILKIWLARLDTDKLASNKNGKYNKTTIALRKEYLRGFKEYLLKASDDSEYKTTYWTYEYYDMLGRKHAADERTFQVEGFKKDKLQQDILLTLNKRLEECGHECNKFGAIFAKAEKHVYANADVPVRWVQSSPTSDGPTAFVEEMKCLKELSDASKSKYSIYSIYADHLQNAYKAATDPNPKTAGM